MQNSLKSQAARELLIRRKSRESLLDYAGAIEIPGKPATDDPDGEFFKPVESKLALHHRLLLEKLQEVSSRPYGRLMVLMPPGSAKSTYASVVFPSQFLGAAPNRRMILASYGDDLARKMGRRTRAIIKQPRYSGIWNCGLSDESKAAETFALTNSSEYMACGILSGVTGNRANGLIIDDPIKGREQANSETIRQKTWDAYNDDLLTRLIPGGWVVLIQTRWHEEDLAGKLLPDGWNGESGKFLCSDGHEWDVLCIQAKCEVDNDPLGRARGEYLWPEWFDRKHWETFENQPITWNSLFQQRPSPLDGGIFKPGKIQVIDAIPAESIKWVRAWDLASVADDGDWTVGGKLGKLQDGRYLIADIERGQWGPDDRDAIMVNTASRDGKSVRIDIPQDPGQAGKSQIAYLTRKLAGYKVNSSPETGDKITRAEPFAAQVNVGNVLMLRAGWNDKLVNEMRMFPNGSNDDQIDSLSRGFASLLTSGRSFFG